MPITVNRRTTVRHHRHRRPHGPSEPRSSVIWPVFLSMERRVLHQALVQESCRYSTSPGFVVRRRWALPPGCPVGEFSFTLRALSKPGRRTAFRGVVRSLPAPLARLRTPSECSTSRSSPACRQCRSPALAECSPRRRHAACTRPRWPSLPAAATQWLLLYGHRPGHLRHLTTATQRAGVPPVPLALPYQVAFRVSGSLADSRPSSTVQPEADASSMSIDAILVLVRHRHSNLYCRSYLAGSSCVLREQPQWHGHLHDVDVVCVLASRPCRLGCRGQMASGPSAVCSSSIGIS